MDELIKGEGMIRTQRVSGAGLVMGAAFEEIGREIGIEIHPWERAGSTWGVAVLAMA